MLAIDNRSSEGRGRRFAAQPKRHPFMMSHKPKSKGAHMSLEPAETTSTPPQPAPSAVQPTGYRISIFPAAVEISARLASAEELQMLVKVLQANAAIWESATKNDASENVLAQAT
jgi:hypothetical protein